MRPLSETILPTTNRLYPNLIWVAAVGLNDRPASTSAPSRAMLLLPVSQEAPSKATGRIALPFAPSSWVQLAAREAKGATV